MFEFTVGGLFSGVGGIELGFQQADYKILWANDIDKYAAKTYRLNLKEKFIEKDVYLLNGNELDPVDILTAGFPCQPFSLAGNREGFNDDRGNLFYEIIRIINELKEKPKVLFLENVKNLYTHDKGRTYSIIENEIKKLGYSVLTSVLNTSEYTNVPQNRERTFIICFADEVNWIETMKPSLSRKFNDIFPPVKSNKNKPLTNYYEKNPVDKKYYYGEEKYMFKELSEKITSNNTVYQWRRIYVRENQKGQCPTLTANMGTGGHNVPLILVDDGIRKLTPRECFSFQGYPKNYKFPVDVPDTQLYKQAGNSVTVPLVKTLAKLIKYVILS